MTVTPDIASYDLILINISGGKDSQVALHTTVEAAREAGVLDRVIAVHADLGRVEWPGTRELAEEHAAHYGIPLEVVGRDQDLLDQIEQRGMFPDAARRYCTSDQKRDPIRKLMTAKVAAKREAGVVGPVRILNVMGMRAQESSARALRSPFRHEGSRTCPCAECQALPREARPANGASNTRRHVDEWLPVHAWTVEEVWECIQAAGTRPHPAYALGMPRLSCRFCVLASRSALVLSAQVNPELAADYARVEEKIGHKFRKDLSMADIIAEAAAAPAPVQVADWAA